MSFSPTTEVPSGKAPLFLSDQRCHQVNAEVKNRNSNDSQWRWVTLAVSAMNKIDREKKTLNPQQLTGLHEVSQYDTGSGLPQTATEPPPRHLNQKQPLHPLKWTAQINTRVDQFQRSQLQRLNAKLAAWWEPLSKPGPLRGLMLPAVSLCLQQPFSWMADPPPHNPGACSHFFFFTKPDLMSTLCVMGGAWMGHTKGG